MKYSYLAIDGKGKKYRSEVTAESREDVKRILSERGMTAIEIGEMKQDQLLDYADEMQLELMTDDDGKIIIMDDKDLGMFINLLSEDYYVSPVNGRRYEIKSKKLLDEPEGEPPRG